jgi:hypothetical protein
VLSRLTTSTTSPFRRTMIPRSSLLSARIIIALSTRITRRSTAERSSLSLRMVRC